MAGNPGRFELRKASAIAMLGLLIWLGGTLRAQTQGGGVQGRIADKAGHALAGATVYLSSPSMQGSRIALTGASGRFDFASLPAGIYTLSAECPGYQTLIRGGIDLRMGMSFFFTLEAEISESETDIALPGHPPSLDAVSAKTAALAVQPQVRNLPLARDFSAILGLAPGAISSGYAFDSNPAIQGGTVRDNVYVLDGANMTDLAAAVPLLHLNINLTDEVEFITAAQPSTLLPAGGAYVNVVSKSGGNSRGGELGLIFMLDKFNANLWTAAQIEDLKASLPVGEKNYAEPEFSLGGPIMADRAWYFMAGRYASTARIGNFIGPYRDILGQVHDPYDWSRQELSGFLKFTVRPVDNASVTLWGSWAGAFQDVAEDPASRVPYRSTHILNHDTSYAIYAAGEYDLSPKIHVYGRAGMFSRNVPKLARTAVLTEPWIDDAADLYGPLNGPDYSSVDNGQRLQAESSVRLFADNLLGMAHTITAGFDFDDSASKLDWWKQNNLLWYMDSRNPNSYFYPDRGVLSFWTAGTVENSTRVAAETLRLGIFLKDTFSIARRLTFTLGLRFERDWTSFTATSKYLSGNSLSVFIGDAIVSPYLQSAYPDVFSSRANPWDQVIVAAKNSLIVWYALSPRAGLAFDIWGNGRTVFKAGYARYPDVLSPRYVLPLHPLYPRSLSVYWQDLNGDGRPDVEDEYSLPNVDYRYLSNAYYPRRVAHGIKAPVTNEISAGLDQEIFRDLTFSLHFVSKQQVNILEDALYAPDSGEIWYAMDQPAAKKFWIPFTTTVPGTASFPSQTVTIYAKSLQAPGEFYQLRNIPELERKYRALEFSFDKRMTHGWQLAGSLVLSKAEGNIGGYAEDTTAFTEAANSPNYFVNRYGPLDTDRPVQIKLMGSVELPFGFGLSAFYHYQSGRPWQRWARILPPADWCAANNVERVYYTVNLEASGSRRDKDWSSLDMRLEKQFALGSTAKMALTADITNLLGFKTSIVGLNDIYSWSPAAEGAGQTGWKVLQPDFGAANTLVGWRTVRFGLKVIF